MKNPMIQSSATTIATQRRALTTNPRPKSRATSRSTNNQAAMMTSRDRGLPNDAGDTGFRRADTPGIPGNVRHHAAVLVAGRDRPALAGAPAGRLMGYSPLRRAPVALREDSDEHPGKLSLIHISEPTRLGMISYAVFCLKKKKNE